MLELLGNQLDEWFEMAFVVAAGSIATNMPDILLSQQWTLLHVNGPAPGYAYYTLKLVRIGFWQLEIVSARE
jgi:hypothetical protein